MAGALAGVPVFFRGSRQWRLYRLLPPLPYCLEPPACYQTGGKTPWGELVGAFLTYWYYHLPDYVLAVLMYTVLGRVVLSLLIDMDSSNYIWRFFCNLTDPVVALVAKVTPKAAAPVVLWLVSFVWLFWMRLLLLILYRVTGLLPVPGAAS